MILKIEINVPDGKKCEDCKYLVKWSKGAECSLFQEKLSIRKSDAYKTKKCL